MGVRGRGGNDGGRGRGNENGNGNWNGNGNRNGKGGAGAKTCDICGKVGHVAQNCRSAIQDKKYCINCKMTNHNTADCTRGGKKPQKQITFTNTETALSTKRVKRPCRFCAEMHLDKDCPNKTGGNGTVMTTYQGDSVYRDVFGPPEYSPFCQHYGGEHLNANCPRIVQQPGDQYQYQRYPAQPARYIPPTKSLWDTCDEIDEEFVVGDPWYPATRMGPVDPNQFPTHYTQEVCAAVYQQQNQRVDRDGDFYMDSMDWEYEDPKLPRW